MPELPEVETIRRQLLPHLPAVIKQTRFSKVVGSIVKTKMFSPTGKTIVKIARKGKQLDFIFDDDTHMLSGLGMSGGWRVSEQPITEKHTHIHFACENASGAVYFAYVDPRRFGMCHFVDSDVASVMLRKLGVDVSSREFTTAYLKKMCTKYPNREIKPFLLDQTSFAGVGNYIACEVLAHARILPTRTAGSITTSDHQQIVLAMKKVLSGSLKKRGLTFSGGYTDATGSRGAALDNLVVFHQQICGLCEKTEVTKITLKGRTTYFCAHCQK
ncbi:MAG: Fpg/Nei family DNA glycosylase [Deltaproteobacteria bacterium]|nr:Fpg/Nei family DNA glycosylase [Deltaproteobacteria bacterium]MBN2673390.1 Fpg/Nei family DNA glycosylase [Deltaproteobacteria bacterium]